MKSSPERAVSSPPHQHRAAPRSTGVMALVLGLLLGMQPLSTDLYLPALPLIQQDLAAPMTGLQLTMAALILGFGCAQLFWGPVSDHYGRRPVLLTALGLFVCASAACAMAETIAELVLLRAAQGATMAAAVVLARAMVRDLYEPLEGAQVMSRGMSGLGVIAMASMPVGGWLAARWGWRASLSAVAGFGALTTAAVWLLLPETHPHRGRHAFSVKGMGRSFATIAAHPGFRSWALLTTATYAGLFVLLSTSAFVYIRTLGLSPVAYGWALGSNSVAYLLGTLVCRRWIGRRGLAGTARRGGWATAMGSAGMLMVGLWGLPVDLPAAGTAQLSGWEVLAAVSPLLLAHWLYAFGHGIHQPCGQTGAVANFPEMAGTASALAGFVLAMSAFAIGLVLGEAFDGSLRFMAWGVAAAGACTTAIAWTWVQQHGTPTPPSSPSP